ncbi:MAG TPA: hypothetical protein VD903_21770 [Pseudonocardia sp.]|nr:hypothetical protein [Pseudonocardia sp.]
MATARSCHYIAITSRWCSFWQLDVGGGAGPAASVAGPRAEEVIGRAGALCSAPRSAA